jgi:N6-adenosine-specific RNA methylase IME4
MAASKPGGAARSAILYQNAACDITLIDIPTSIAAAQGRVDTLLSTPPLEAPIALHEEPKTQKAKTNQSQHLPADPTAEYKDSIEKALAQIRQNVSNPWCVPRKLMTRVPKAGEMDMQIDDPEKELESRLREWAALDEGKGEDGSFDFQKMMDALCTTPGADATVTEGVAHKWSMSYQPARELVGDARPAIPVSRNEPNTQHESWMTSFHNPEKRALDLAVYETPTRTVQETPEYRFTIPPQASFFLSDSTHSEAFRASFREVTDEYRLPRHFDLILLDPPWPNRSAKRKGAYEQVGGMPFLRKMLLGMDIDNYLEHNALVGIWITNKQALRHHVLGPGGLFEKWNVGLVEEWIWVKTTVHGEPMFDLDSTLRKPYEVLLLGRAAPNSWTTMAAAASIKKRVMAAVPDIHSRKPCLKELLEPYMPDVDDYSALEVFSRNLVSGWTSWGNEVLKYNAAQYWASNSDTPAAALST